jgi:putative membrane protein
MNNPEDQPRFDVSPSAANHFAWIRTRLALERTLMAWARTSVSLIGFGFTIVQFFQRVQTSSTALPVLLPEAPRNFGLALIASGIIGLLVSIWQYQRAQRYLWSGPFRALAGIEQDQQATPIIWVAIVLLLVGIFAFVVVLFRWS